MPAALLTERLSLEPWEPGYGAFQRLGAPSVVARVAPDNDASLGVARAIGLTREADGRGRFGEPITVLRLTAADWSALVGDAR